MPGKVDGMRGPCRRRKGKGGGGGQGSICVVRIWKHALWFRGGTLFVRLDMLARTAMS